MSANEIRIEEISGAQRARITLRNRAMPYRGVETGGEQRVKTTWYQGNPKATQQVLGSTLDPTTLEGMWKSKFIIVSPPGEPFVDVEIENLALLLGTSFATAARDAQPAALAVAAFELLRDRGRELRFQWGDVIRYGVLTNFVPTWDRYEDVRWSATFTWNGRTERVPRSGRVVTYGQPVQTAQTNLDNALVAAPRLVPDRTQANVFALASQVRSKVVDLLSYTRQAVSAVTLPLRVVQGAASIAHEVQTTASDLALQCLGVPYAAFSTFDDVVDVFKAEDWRRTVGGQTEALVARSIEERNKMNDLSDNLSDAIRVRTTQRTSLRALAAQYYGSESDWTLIAATNGLDTSVVEAGELVFVPLRATTTTNSEATR